MLGEWDFFTQHSVSPRVYLIISSGRLKQQSRQTTEEKDMKQAKTNACSTFPYVAVCGKCGPYRPWRFDS
jgi:hypothetical protein